MNLPQQLLENNNSADILGIKTGAVAGTEAIKNPSLYNAFMQLQTPTSQDSQQFNNWYSDTRKINPNLRPVPVGDDYNMYGFWKASQQPNSGVGTEINPNDHKLHFSDSYQDPNNKTIALKAPWHKAAWTMAAAPLLEQGLLNNQDIQNINNWNAKRLGVPNNQGGW